MHLPQVLNGIRIAKAIAPQVVLEKRWAYPEPCWVMMPRNNSSEQDECMDMTETDLYITTRLTTPIQATTSGVRPFSNKADEWERSSVASLQDDQSRSEVRHKLLTICCIQ
ncbi:hypothetical protein M413DRAFT_345498 [Hebeloma cylindrosporum]|uniref:Uncharacterized protein n=1 Tax=Hebeloma cylindrosporum TaxID=76867 RepID=A0A0C3CPG1_HEBCY|nr:hypothetical protein M413DRAFT_345498 [Hebeloma cylindrosporum h7]